jgi:phosphatidyl-myo-inositol dimannoside synthase
MEIFFVARRYHPSVGGVETQIRMIAHELSQRHSVELVASRFVNGGLSGRQYLERVANREEPLLRVRHRSWYDGPVTVHALVPPLVEQAFMRAIRKRGIPPEEHYVYSVPRRLGYFIYRAANVGKLRQLMRGKDVVHSLTADYLGWAAEEAARAEGIPFLVSPYVHPGQSGDDPENIDYYNRADIVFALFEPDRRKLIDLGVEAEKVRISGLVPLLPESSDPSRFRARHGLGNKPVVLFVGRHDEFKGPRALADAAPRIWQTCPNVHFLFAGPADFAAQRWLAEFRDERIRYLGVINEQEKADAMAACDLFCMPSRYEVLGAVYLEAWSYGKPVLGGTAYGLHELIEGNGAGLVVEQDPQLIAARVLELIQDEDRRRRMGERGLELVQRQFSRQVLLRNLEDAYAAATSVAAHPQPFSLVRRQVRRAERDA